MFTTVGSICIRDYHTLIVLLLKGNGTQRAFYDDDTVLYISLHRYDNGEYYPNGPFGSMLSCGDGKGLG